MIFEGSSRCTALPTTSTMLRSVSPAVRQSCSPAISEISVGSPSPPPSGSSFQLVTMGFRPLNVKRRRLSQERTRSPFSPRQKQPHLEPRRKSSAERVKSFSIADILGENDDDTHEDVTSSEPSAPAAAAALALTSTCAPPPSFVPHSTVLPPAVNLLHQRLQPLPPPCHPLLADMTTLGKVVRPWDSLRGPANLPLHPFLPPALLHYEQRLSWDYQRQLQEHFQAQALLLRQMSMDPTIIPSDDGSERSRSRSSSTGASECNSPEVDVQNGSNADECVANAEAGRARDDSGGPQAGKPPSDTPLDALFQLSTKNFDAEQDPATLNIFATRPNPKKKRKSRTAFTNHQIFELEKRFLYQKYLSPADRDEIAGGLGLSNAQVITWFQNRRAKLKRDMEELKKDVETVKQLPDQSADIIHHRQHQHQQHQQQQQQQQQQKQFHLPRHLHFLPYQQLQPHLLTTTTAATTSATTNGAASSPTATVAAQRQHNLNRDSASTTAEDKKEIKMLKMMTLMYYSSRNDAAVAAAAAAAAGDVGNPGAKAPQIGSSVDRRKQKPN